MSSVGWWAGNSSTRVNLHAIPADACNLAEPHTLPIAQFIALADLRAQHAPQMMRRFAFHDGASASKLFNEESSAHGGDSSLDTVPRTCAERIWDWPGRDSRPVLADR